MYFNYLFLIIPLSKLTSPNDSAVIACEYCLPLLNNFYFSYRFCLVKFTNLVGTARWWRLVHFCQTFRNFTMETKQMLGKEEPLSVGDKKLELLWPGKFVISFSNHLNTDYPKARKLQK
jgi:hypothetical protein